MFYLSIQRKSSTLRRKDRDALSDPANKGEAAMIIHIYPHGSAICHVWENRSFCDIHCADHCPLNIGEIKGKLSDRDYPFCYVRVPFHLFLLNEKRV